MQLLMHKHAGFRYILLMTFRNTLIYLREMSSFFFFNQCWTLWFLNFIDLQEQKEKETHRHFYLWKYSQLLVRQNISSRYFKFASTFIRVSSLFLLMVCLSFSLVTVKCLLTGLVSPKLMCLFKSWCLGANNHLIKGLNGENLL